MGMSQNSIFCCIFKMLPLNFIRPFQLSGWFWFWFHALYWSTGYFCEYWLLVLVLSVPQQIYELCEGGWVRGCIEHVCVKNYVGIRMIVFMRGGIRRGWTTEKGQKKSLKSEKRSRVSPFPFQFCRRCATGRRHSLTFDRCSYSKTHVLGLFCDAMQRTMALGRGRCIRISFMEVRPVVWIVWVVPVGIIQYIPTAERFFFYFIIFFVRILSVHITGQTAGSRLAVTLISNQSEENSCMLEEEGLETLVRVWKEHSGLFDEKLMHTYIQWVRYCVQCMDDCWCVCWTDALLIFPQPPLCPLPDYSNEYGCLFSGESAHCSSPSRGRRQGEAACSLMPLVE